MSQILLAQLYAIRSQLDATIMAVELSLPVAPVPNGCPHPEDKQQVSSTMGGGPQTVLCLQCGMERNL